MAADLIGQGLMVWRSLLEFLGSVYFIIIVILGFSEVEKLTMWKAIGAFVIVFGALLLLTIFCLSLSALPS